MMSPSLGVSFPNLTIIVLFRCKSCPQLPPLGLLPHLKSLSISEAEAIKTIGPEFLGPRASSAATSFPNLEELRFEQMSNWEEWSFGIVEGVGEERRGAPKLLPRLMKLQLYRCPKLRALPPLGLLPQLKYLYIRGARAIKTIGPEFLGLHASSATTSFPKLEELEFTRMSNWEEWSFGMVEGVGEETTGAPKLLPRLTKLKLEYCPALRALPPLGLLPQLKSLCIREARAIKTIGPEFLGPRASSAATSFPKLEELQFIGMSNWEEWSFGMVEGVGEERRGALKLLPRLMKLKVERCPKLRALPPLGLLPELKSLIIFDAYAIKTIGPEFLRPRASSAATSFPKLEELHFYSMKNWEEWSFGMVEGVGEERRGAPKLLPCLKKLKLLECPKLRALPPLGLLPQLKLLRISGAGAIKTIGPEFFGPRASSAATSFPNLEELYLCNMSNWEEWSFGMVEGVGEETTGAPKLLPRLTELKLEYCPALRALPPLGLLPHLKSLSICGAEAIKTIGPEFFGPRASSGATSFPKLEVLFFYDMANWEEWSFGMVEGVGEERRGAPKLLPRLTKLELSSCPKLRALPEGLRHATNLQELNIYGAANLKEISNLPSLKYLSNCPRLEHVKNLDKLQL
ncbi:uncharacterized protein [Elaeis guineensis]|uniref:uncharacterized protein n=1 Tax=Elaeis guineensis var. tenera TaxID=51953 RepID=UPI003C6DB10E